MLPWGLNLDLTIVRSDGSSKEAEFYIYRITVSTVFLDGASLF